MKKYVTIILATGALAIAFMAGKAVGAAETAPTPGSTNDPLVTKSYVQPLENRIAALEAKAKTYYSRGYQSKSQTLKSRTWTKILFQGYDNPSGLYLSGSRFTAPETGNYLVVGFTGINSISSGNKVVTSIFRNGKEYSRLYEDNKGYSGNIMAGGTAIIYMQKGNYIELFTYVSSSKTTIYGSNKTFVQVYKLK